MIPENSLAVNDTELNVTTQTADTTTATEMQLVTFHVGELLLGIPIEFVQEINRNLDMTLVPHAPDHVRGVINLRGEVTTVVDLGKVLGFSPTEIATGSRNIIVRFNEETIGLLVDSVADILTIKTAEIAETPANVPAGDGRYFNGVHRTGDALIVILDVEEVLATS